MGGSYKTNNNEYFSIPQNKLFIPKSRYGQELKLGLIEIGKLPNGKRKQLLVGKQLFEDDVVYLNNGWTPQIIRTLVHSDLESHKKGVFNKFKEYNPDVVLFYGEISDRIYSRILDKQFYRAIKYSKEKIKDELIRMWFDKDLDQINDIFYNKGRCTNYSSFRGKILETIVLNDLFDNKPDEVSLRRNKKIVLNNKGDFIEKEIDGILMFYNFNDYWELIKNLDSNNDINIIINNDLKNLPDIVNGL